MERTSINDISSPSSDQTKLVPQPQPIQLTNKNPEHDEPGLYHALGVFCFATATFL